VCKNIKGGGRCFILSTFSLYVQPFVQLGFMTQTRQSAKTKLIRKVTTGDFGCAHYKATLYINPKSFTLTGVTKYLCKPELKLMCSDKRAMQHGA
jgi:hypothetical protein